MQLAWLVPSLLFGVYLGATTGQWQMIFMSAASATVWLAVRRFGWSGQFDFGQPIRVTDHAVYVGDRKLPAWSMLWKREWHDRIFEHLNGQQNEQSQLDRWQFEVARAAAATSQAQFFLGLANGKPLAFDPIGDSPHALIVGATGSGKSQLLKQMLNSVISNPRDQSEFLLVDFKGGASFAGFASKPRVKAILSDIDGHDSELAWQAVSSELNARERFIASHNCSRIEELHQRLVALPRLFIFVDELAALMQVSPAATIAISAVLARGRSLGVHFVGATQSAQGLTRAMLTNLRTRIALGDVDPMDQAQLGMKRATATQSLGSGWVTGQINSAVLVNTSFQFALGGPDIK